MGYIRRPKRRIFPPNLSIPKLSVSKPHAATPAAGSLAHALPFLACDFACSAVSAGSLNISARADTATVSL